MGFYIRGLYKINKVFLETLADVYKINEVFFETLVDAYKISEVFLEILIPSPTTLFYMIGCHKEGKRGVFTSLRIVTFVTGYFLITF